MSLPPPDRPRKPARRAAGAARTVRAAAGAAPPLSFDSLLLVDAIARTGSFAAAAAALDRVPSAVTYAVRKLEDDLDVLLFDRSGYRARLTPAGEELLREGRHLVSAVDDLARRVQRVAEGWERELRIALDTTIPFDRLLPLLSRFCAVAPTRVRIATEVLGGSWDALLTGRADLVIGAAYEAPESGRLGSGLRTLPLGQIEMVFAVAPTHPLAQAATPIALPTLRRHRQIVVGDTSRREAARDAGSQAGGAGGRTRRGLPAVSAGAGSDRARRAGDPRHPGRTPGCEPFAAGARGLARR